MKILRTVSQAVLLACALAFTGYAGGRDYLCYAGDDIGTFIAGEVIEDSVCFFPQPCSSYKHPEDCHYCLNGDVNVRRCIFSENFECDPDVVTLCGFKRTCQAIFLHQSNCSYVQTGCDWATCSVTGTTPCPEVDCD